MQKTKQYVKHAQQRIKERSPARNRKLFQVECDKAYAAFEHHIVNAQKRSCRGAGTRESLTAQQNAERGIP